MFKRFLEERQYLRNVSAHTIRWYTDAFNWLPNDHPTRDELKDVVLRMRSAGLKPTGCNAATGR